MQSFHQQVAFLAYGIYVYSPTIARSLMLFFFGGGGLGSFRFLPELTHLAWLYLPNTAVHGDAGFLLRDLILSYGSKESVLFAMDPYYGNLH